MSAALLLVVAWWVVNSDDIRLLTSRVHMQTYVVGVAS